MLSSNPKPEFCTRCRGPLIEVAEPGDFDSQTGERKVWYHIKCSRFGRPWWRRLGRPATYHDSYLVLDFDSRITYNLATWK